MEDKSLQDKAVNIKGKQYVLVQDRVLYFNEKYPKGWITTELLSAPNDTRVVVRATVYTGENASLTAEAEERAFYPLRKFTGLSQAVVGEGVVNKTAALENAETSAVGRALAFMGIGVIESIASADEMQKATTPVKPAAPKGIEAERSAKKKLIAELLNKKALVPLETKKDYEEACEAHTGLKLEEGNYNAILDILQK